MIVAGIGCKTGLETEPLLVLLRKVATLGLGVPRLLAAPDFRRGEKAILAAAEALELPILWITTSALKSMQSRCLTRSPRAEQETGLASVAEAAALAGAGPGARLILARIQGGGVTCALAEGPIH